MKRLSALAGAALLLLLTAGCEPPAETPEPLLRPVQYLEARTGNVARVRTYSGTSRYRRESQLSFKVGGSIRSVDVNVGDSVQAGSLLASLDPSTYQLQVQQAQATLAQTTAAERNAVAAYDRLKGLYENGSASRNDLDAARAAAESSRAQVNAAEKALELSRLNASYTRLRADANCLIAAVDIELNENVSAGAPVMSITCGRAIEIRVDVPESLVGELRRNMPAAVNFAAIPGESFSARLSELGVASSVNSATFPVTVVVDREDEMLRSGLAAQVSFRIGEAADTGIRVPLAAVGEDAQGAFLFVAEATTAGEGIVRRRAITLGELTADGVEVLTGLANGERVVTAGVSVIRDGQAVLLD